MNHHLGLGVDAGSWGCRFAAHKEGLTLPLWVPRQFDEMEIDLAGAHPDWGGTDPVGESLQWKLRLGESADGPFGRPFMQELLARGIQAAAAAGNGPVEQLALCVPASFSVRQRQVLNACATAAGALHVFLVSDSVALVAARPRDQQEEHLLVYQCGYSGLEIAVVSALNESIHVLSYATGGTLSGRRLDQELILQLATRASLPQEEQQLLVCSERFVRLTASSLRDRFAVHAEVVVDLELPSGRPAQMHLSRRDWKHGVRQAVDHSLQDVHAALSEARMRASDLTRILLAGGPTADPAFAQVLRERLGKPVLRLSDWSAAYGAASLASRLRTAPSSEASDLTLSAETDSWAEPLSTPPREPPEAAARLTIPLRLVRPEDAPPGASAEIPARPPETGSPSDCTSASHPAEPGKTRSAALRTLQLAERLLQEDRLREAVAMSHQAFLDDSQSAEVLSRMQGIHRRAAAAKNTPEGYTQAVQWLLCANQHDPTDLTIRQALAERHALHARQMLDLGQPQQALKAAQIAFYLQPESAAIERLLDAAREITQPRPP